ncbi:Uncharacterized protein GBIM_20823 [Gryllus bimaculatus]|nr:Uncharacterized protein GBIM_20823 [Gryllus bimaculatus]
MLNGFRSTNRVLDKQGVADAHAQACEHLSTELLQRMATARAASSFPWLRANLLLLAAIAALLAYDVRRHGSLQENVVIVVTESSTGHLLRDIGALPYVEDGWSQTQSYSQQSYTWLLKNGPEYYRQACEVSSPYLIKAQEILLSGMSYAISGCKTIYAYGHEKAPLVSEWVEQWAPGLRDRAIEFSLHVWEQGIIYSIAGGKILLEYGQDAVTWARTNVFVGSWSPDNIQQYSWAVLNVTQEYALGTYDWLYQKVQTFSKVE